MNINLESLDQIPHILELVVQMKKTLEQGQVAKRWLNTHESADYLGYKHETMKSKIKRGEFIIGVEYYKHDGKNLFDKIELDNRVMGIKSENNHRYGNKVSTDIVNDILSSLAS